MRPHYSSANSWLCLALLALVGILFPVSEAPAQILEKLIMPGPVIEGHAEWEGQCRKCHTVFGDTEQRDLCLDCHDKVDKDLNAQQGFHSHIKDIATVECSSCHKEHQGRDADIVLLDEEAFDHRKTDFTLKGSHATAPCSGCHLPKKKYREAPSLCNDCHKPDDPHQGRLGVKCGDCHVEDGWREAKFDHDKSTDFALKGEHAKVTCNACHVNELYENTDKRCVACHWVDDVHEASLGDKCADCHNEKDWEEIRFDHAKDTEARFALTGKHAKQACSACHIGPQEEQNLKTDCVACHENDDSHNGRNGTKCKDCHSTESWGSSEFKHDRDTDFPLRGSHAPLDCTACHKGSVTEEELGTKCIDCHRNDDVHAGSEGETCNDCHNEEGWRTSVQFDHDLSNFPLIGQHAVAPCEECHVTAAYKETTRECAKCHEADDVHEKTLGPACGQCHNPNGWVFWAFDHNTQTEYTLRGNHDGLKCDACHVEAKTEQGGDPSKICGDCHRRDDVHRGAYGTDCGECHNSRSFKELRIDR